MIFPCITLTGKDGGSEGEGEDDEDEAEDMEDADDEGEGGEGSDDEGGSDNSEAGDEESAQQDKRGGSGGKGDKAKPEACKGGKGHVHTASCPDRSHGQKRPASELATEPESKDAKKVKSQGSAGSDPDDPVVVAAAAVHSCSSHPGRPCEHKTAVEPNPASTSGSVSAPSAGEEAAAAVAVAEAEAVEAAAPVSVVTMQGGGAGSGCSSVESVPPALRLEIAICDLEPQGEGRAKRRCAGANPCRVAEGTGLGFHIGFGRLACGKRCDADRCDKQQGLESKGLAVLSFCQQLWFLWCRGEKTGQIDLCRGHDWNRNAGA